MLRLCKRSGSAEGSGELSEDKGVVSAAAGDDQLMKFMFGKNESVECIDDGKGREERGGADKVVRLGVMFFGEREELLDIRGAVVFAASAFGRREFQIGIFH